MIVSGLRVFDIRGRLVRDLVSEAKTPPTYRVLWDGKADNGRYAASAMYRPGQILVTGGSDGTNPPASTTACG